MEITNIISFLVPDKSAPEEIEGVVIPRRGKLFDIAKAIFNNEHQVQPLNVTFVKEENTGQSNAVRSLIKEFSARPTIHTGNPIAIRLKSHTTKRSGVGLLMLIVAKDQSATAMSVCRFPAEEGIMASKTEDGLKVEFIEKVFLKDAHSFKSVRYDDVHVSTGCWNGIAIDRQINDSIREVSDYWIKGFLLSDYNTKPKAGTKRFAQALKKAISTTSDSSVKRELIASGILARNYSGKVMSPQQFYRESRLSQAAIVVLEKAFPNRQCISDPFIFDLEAFDENINIRCIELDTGAMMIAPITKFDEIVKIEANTNGTSTLSTSGRIVKTHVKGMIK